MDLRLKRSEGLKQLMIFQDFNYETMKAEVRNVDPSNLSAAVYRQIHCAKISIQNEKTGCVYNVDVALTEEEKQQFDGLNSESEKIFSSKKLPKVVGYLLNHLRVSFNNFLDAAKIILPTPLANIDRVLICDHW
jgi:glycyl-tRNA synthetase alpha subunit